MIKLLHAADLHLDSPFAALSPAQAAARRAEQRTLVEELVDLCNRQACDLMLLAGDLFDSDNAYAQTVETLVRAFSRCHAAIFIAPGNHDFYAPGCAYETADWPSNVHIFQTQTPSSRVIPELGCQVYRRGLYRPLLPWPFGGLSCGGSGTCQPHGPPWGGRFAGRSDYNPVAQGQIAASGLTYLALGHIHQASGLRRAGTSFYGWPGCTMGRGFDEAGPKGCYVVTLDRGGAQADFVPLGREAV